MLTCNKFFTVCISMLLAQPVAAAEKYAPTSVDMEVKKVSEHVYYVEGVPGIATDNALISNAGIVITGDGVVLRPLARHHWPISWSAESVSY